MRGEGCVAKQFFTREKADNLSKGGTKHCTGFCCFNYFALFSLYPVSQSKLGSTTTPACLAHHPWPVRKGCAWRISKAIAICSLVHYISSSFASCSFLAKRCYGMKSLACALDFSCTSHKLPESCCQYIYVLGIFFSDICSFVCSFFFLRPTHIPTKSCRRVFCCSFSVLVLSELTKKLKVQQMQCYFFSCQSSG